MVELYFSDESFALAEKAKNDPDFGVLYAYMCLYSEYVLDSSPSNKSYLSLNLNENLYSKKLLQICENDFKTNFKASQSQQIIDNYFKDNFKAYNLASTQKLNGYKIQEYARKNAYKTPAAGYIYLKDRDCTNFVSQALHYGGLNFKYSKSVLEKSGIIDDRFSWYFFENNTESGYCVSTSFIRTEELHPYLLSKGFSSTTAYLKRYITPELEPGYILQGKHFWKTRFSHSVIVTFTENEPTYCAHSKERMDEPIDTFYKGFYKYRVIRTY